ncbi:MAG TPA: hypothetical protein VJ733_08610 [Candidatus Binatia bacterium]|nr:hypothetical protein [Candidatus Binatia bacterium]
MDKIFQRIDRFFMEFLAEMETAYDACSNVSNIEAWYRRLDELTLARERGDATYRQIEDHVFELKVINYLNLSFLGVELTYEPLGIRPEGRNCDLGAKREGREHLIEIKSFHPEPYRKRVPTKRIAPTTKVHMDEESYHAYQATRGHLIDVVYETEQKIANYVSGPVAVLAVPDGFHLNREDLRDFVYIYRNGRPRYDDPLGPMTMHNLRGRFSGSIKEYWAMPFPQESFACHNDKAPAVIGALINEDRDITI